MSPSVASYVLSGTSAVRCLSVGLGSWPLSRLPFPSVSIVGIVGAGPGVSHFSLVPSVTVFEHVEERTV